ncbi:hypothetical protein PILCRDRAFT_189006 [Piloderma croceum F 1598]|uniref:Uncharacterized protein n=1 Tax=Piloderma croceum (strain F 1598) TaxID=765440 RepID=A0A0C3GIX8_PILCF|nr:hypothetical protein PILCRDRAFT_189006 [Piloderma croceum F 1598]
MFATAIPPEYTHETRTAGLADRFTPKLEATIMLSVTYREKVRTRDSEMESAASLKLY